MASFYLHHLFKDLISKYGHIMRKWGLVFQHRNLGGTLGPQQQQWIIHHAILFALILVFALLRRYFAR